MSPRDEAPLKNPVRPLFAGDEGGLDAFPGREPDPAWAALVADELARLLGALPGEDLRRVARHQMEGHTTAEIARRLGCSVHSVERKRQLVRQFWLEWAGW